MLWTNIFTDWQKSRQIKNKNNQKIILITQEAELRLPQVLMESIYKSNMRTRISQIENWLEYFVEGCLTWVSLYAHSLSDLWKENTQAFSGWFPKAPDPPSQK